MTNTGLTDVIPEQRIRRVIEEEQEHVLLFDEFFRTINIDEDHPSDTIEIPIDEGEMGMPEDIDPGGEFPLDKEGYDREPITVRKKGKGVAVPMESSLYSIFDYVAQQIEKASRRMGEYINEWAFRELEDNLHPAGPIEGDGEFNYELVTEARKEILDEKFSPDYMVVNTAAEKDLLNSDEFQRASDLGDETVREGREVIGRIANTDVEVDNSGLLGEDTGRAIMGDTDEYGYEVVKQNVDSEEYYEPRNQSDVFQIFTIRQFKAIRPEAAIEIRAE